MNLKPASHHVQITKPAERKRATLGQIRSWLRAELSLLRQGPVPLEVFNDRMSHCMECPYRVVDEDNDPGYCDKCGCGSKNRARLTIKLHMPKAKCPISKWRESKGEGRAALERIGGAREQVIAQVRQAAGGLAEVVLGWCRIRLDQK